MKPTLDSIMQKLTNEEQDLLRSELAKPKSLWFELLFEKAPYGIIVSDTIDMSFKFANKKICDMLGYERHELTRESVSSIVPHTEIQKVLEEYNAKRGKQTAQNIRLQRKDKRIIYADINISQFSFGGSDYNVGFFRDVTDQYNDRVKVELFQRIVDKSPAITMVTNPEGFIEYVNPRFTKVSGYSATDVLNKSAERLGEMSEDQLAKMWEVLASGKEWRGIFPNRKKNGELYYEAASISAIKDDEGNILHFIKVAEDVTDTVKYQKSLEKTNKEKEGLFKEMNHRVKNNFAMIHSLLSLESVNLHGAAKEIFRKCGGRVKAMSEIHESLYKLQEYDSVNCQEYFTKLAEDLAEQYAPVEKEIQSFIDIEIEHLELNQAIPCALIANELFTNTMKYAFNSRESGNIHFSMAESNDIYQMVIKDNGIGMKQNRKPSVGTQIVDALVDQLSGKLEIHVNGGTEFKITFPKQYR